MTNHFRIAPALLACAALLGACETLYEPVRWLEGGPQEIKRAPGERKDVLAGLGAIVPDSAAQAVTVDVPEQTNLPEWKNRNESMLTAHIGLTGVTREQSSTIGKGDAFTRSIAPSPVVGGGYVFAMDAAGGVSAHDESDIATVQWIDRTDRADTDALGGGLAYADGIVYATIGTGRLRALDAASGKVKWNISVGAPVRGAPAAGGGLIVVVTADNQTLAFDAQTGQPRWEHRGIREAAGYFSTTSPVIEGDAVVSAYSSGELFVLALNTGSVRWSDMLAGSARTKASAVLSGIDADPIVQDGVVVVVSTGGEMQASAILNGRPLWQQRLGAHATPWSAGNVIYALSDTHDLVALLKRDGTVRWATSLAVSDNGRDVTPPLYGPILSANAVLVIDGEGVLTSFKPTDGTKIGSFELESGVLSHPVVANGALYLVSRDAKLYKYY